MEGTKQNKMGTAPMFRLILGMSLPAMFSMLIQALYNIVDSMFVSNYSNSILTGNDSLLSVNIAYPLQMILISVAVGSGVGVNSLIARRLGARHQEQADSAATHGFFLTFIDWFIFVLIGIFLAKPFISLYTNDQAIMDASVAYIRIVLIGSLGSNITCMLEKVLQSTGNMIMPMLSQLTGAVINIILDPIFIYTFDLGVAGAAIATIIAQHISAVLCLFFLFGKKQLVKIHVKGFRFRAETVKNIYVVALPAMVMQAIGSFMVMGINFIISLAHDTVAAKNAATNVFGVYFKLQSFVFMPVFGLNNGMVPIVSYNYGAQNKKRLTKTIKLAIMYAVCIMFIGIMLFQFIPDVLLKLFDASDHMLEIGIPALRVISLSFAFAGICIVISSSLQALGHGFLSMMISITRQLIILLPSAYILAKFGGIHAVWWSFNIAEIGSLTLSLLFFKHMYNKIIKHLGE